ncbi:MAG: pyridoxamine 5'-phosphate oxidase family protein [Dehalococcoidia bacterium]|nr:pyridoxamine 5'-phosphate oxidase family protein [Dehalococcoidia bacterium]
MTEPRADRPHMPDYRISRDKDGLLPWSWARERLDASHNYWVATTRPDGQPHVTAVWGVWLGDVFYFSMGATSRKARNLAANTSCTVTTEHADEAVIVEGKFAGAADASVQATVRDAYKRKYDWDTEGYDFFAVRPLLAFAFTESAASFAQTATRWRFA